MKIKFYGRSIRNKREVNMDTMLTVASKKTKENVHLFVVCDGVGSLKHGDLASKLIVQKCERWLETITDTSKIGLSFRDFTITMNQEIAKETVNQKSASTMTVLIIANGKYYIIHIGDSRIYLFDKKTMKQISTDDNAKDGKLSGYIGFDKSIVLQYYDGELTEKSFFMCSDGVYKKLSDESIHEIIKKRRSIKYRVEKLIKTAVKAGEKDNITAVIVESRS